MKKVLSLIFLVLFLYFPGYSQDTSKFEIALNATKEQNKPLMVFFTASWCAPCQSMKKYVLMHSYVQNFISENYIFLILDVDTEEGAFKYKEIINEAIAVPQIVVLDAEQNVKKRLDGAVTLNRFKEFIHTVDGYELNQDIIYTGNTTKYRGKAWYNMQCFKIKPGIRIGMNFTDFHSNTSQSYNNRIGYHIGISGRSYINRRIYLESALMFNSIGAKRDNNVTRLNYMEVPVTFGVNLLWAKFLRYNSVRLNITPYVAMGVGGKNKVHFGTQDDKFKRWDYGFQPALNLQLGSFELRGGYRLGLNNISNIPGEKLFNRGFFFTTGINLGI